MPQILVVEDDITLRTAFVHQLDRLGLEADSAANGYEAMRRIRAWQYELIFMDLHMPDMDGFETIAAIRTHEQMNALPRIPIIAVSGSGEEDRALECGADAYFLKPAQLADIKQLVDKWLP